MADYGDRFFEWLAEFLYRMRLASLSDALRRWNEKDRPAGSAAGLRAERVVAPADNGLRLNPKGFYQAFDPRRHAALPEFQKQAVHWLFAQFRLPWIPPEYLRWLRAFPDPVDAFERFAEELGLKMEPLRRRNRAEVTLLEQGVGILMELGQMVELNDTLKGVIRDRLRERAYITAEELIDVARTVFRIVREAEDVGKGIEFPMYQKGFVEPLKGFLKVPFKLSPAEAVEAKAFQARFMAEQDRLNAHKTRYQEELAHLADRWPADPLPPDSWFADNALVREGYFLAYQEWLEKLTMTDLLPDDIDVTLENLDAMLTDLEGFLKEMEAAVGGPGFSASADPAPLEKWNAWVAAARQFGWSETDDPDAVMIKKRYRRAAMEYHPDRHRSASPAEQARMADLFDQATKAYDVLQAGKPPKP